MTEARIFNLLHAEARGGIYLIEHIDSGRVYVGSSSDIDRRWRQHLHRLRRMNHQNAKLQNLWAKYGEAAFRFSVVECLVDESMLLEREQSHMDAIPAGLRLNISTTAGRERAGTKHSDHSIDLMREAHRGKRLSKEHKKSLSAAFAGRVFSESHKARISEAKRGTKRPPATDQARANLSAAKKGCVHSLETRAKLSAAHTGKVMSAEARANMSAAQKRRYAKP